MRDRGFSFGKDFVLEERSHFVSVKVIIISIEYTIMAEVSQRVSERRDGKINKLNNKRSKTFKSIKLLSSYVKQGKNK